MSDRNWSNSYYAGGSGNHDPGNNAYGNNAYGNNDYGNHGHGNSGYGNANPANTGTGGSSDRSNGQQNQSWATQRYAQGSSRNDPWTPYTAQYAYERNPYANYNSNNNGQPRFITRRS